MGEIPNKIHHAGRQIVRRPGDLDAALLLEVCQDWATNLGNLIGVFAAVSRKVACVDLTGTASN
jgi:hypothetical protein